MRWSDAIYFEEAGRWHTGDGLRFLAIALAVVLPPWTALVWFRTRYLPRNDACQTTQ